VTFRVGHGFDVHAVDTQGDRPLLLGGVRFDGPGLVGHSDADVVAHAAAEALLGAAGLGDLGQHFPDDDPAWAGADSVGILGQVADLLRREGWRVLNVDCSVVLEAPRLAPVRERMQERLSRAVGGDVTVKARRPEGLGALGRGEGVACFAVALVEKG